MIDSDADVGLTAVIDLTNELAVAKPDDAAAAVRRVLAVDPPTIAKLTDRDMPAMVSLAHLLYPICERLHGGDVDGAASLINELLVRYSAHPHLASEDGRWRLHHHPVDADAVAMWTAIAADALARLVGNGHHDRIGICRAPGCGRVFLDTTKNGSRRFCSTTCQNRVKAAAFRRRNKAS